LADDKTQDIDSQVLRRVAGSSRATQRWLKTALQTIRTMPPAGESAPSVRPARPAPEPAPAPEPEPRAPDLDDMLTGRRSLKEQMDARPELAEELEGLADVIDMLRDLGRERRKEGEDILSRDDFLRLTDDEEEPDEDV